jgi:hypothetical protein
MMEVEQGSENSADHDRSFRTAVIARMSMSRPGRVVFIPDIALRLRCSPCGARGLSRIMPEHRDWRESRDRS